VRLRLANSSPDNRTHCYSELSVSSPAPVLIAPAQEGWPGWVAWINIGMVYPPPKVVTNPSTNRARRSITLLMWPMPLRQTSHQFNIITKFQLDFTDKQLIELNLKHSTLSPDREESNCTTCNDCTLWTKKKSTGTSDLQLSFAATQKPTKFQKKTKIHPKVKLLKTIQICACKFELRGDKLFTFLGHRVIPMTLQSLSATQTPPKLLSGAC